jgi:hypothetical protein
MNDDNHILLLLVPLLAHLTRVPVRRKNSPPTAACRPRRGPRRRTRRRCRRRRGRRWKANADQKAEQSMFLRHTFHLEHVAKLLPILDPNLIGE